MSYFPVSLKIDNKKFLLIGGGNIAAFKLNKIKLFQPQSLLCISRKFSPDFLKECDGNEELKTRDFLMSDLDGADIVIVAVDDIALQELIYKECQQRKILCNCVDLIHCCDFIFPSILKKGDITIAVTSSGLVPGFSAEFKTYLEKLIPENLENGFQAALNLRRSLPPGPARMAAVREMAKNFFISGVKNEK